MQGPGGTSNSASLRKESELLHLNGRAPELIQTRKDLCRRLDRLRLLTLLHQKECCISSALQDELKGVLQQFLKHPDAGSVAARALARQLEGDSASPIEILLQAMVDPVCCHFAAKPIDDIIVPVITRFTLPYTVAWYMGG